MVDRPLAAWPEGELPHRQHDQRCGQHLHEGWHVDRAELAACDTARHRRTEQAVPGLDHLGQEEAGDLREVAALGGHQLGDAAGLRVAVVAPPAHDQAAQQIGAGAVVALGPPGGGGDERHHAFAHHRLEQLFLVGKVQVQGAFGDAGARRHVVQPGAGVATLDEQVEPGGQQLRRPVLLAAFPARRSGGRDFDGEARHGVLLSY